MKRFQSEASMIQANLFIAYGAGGVLLKIPLFIILFVTVTEAAIIF